MVEKEEGRSFKREGFLGNIKRYYYLYIILIVLIIFVLFYFFLSTQFKVGDIVYSKNIPSNIGRIESASLLKTNYIVAWNDGGISEEKAQDIGRIEDLNIDEVNNSINSTVGNKFSPWVYGSKTDYNFTDYTIERVSGNEQVIGIFYSGFSLGVNLTEKNCIPKLRCGIWGDCRLEYNVLDLSLGNIGSGIQYRKCNDENHCLPGIIDSRQCSLHENITVRKSIVCNKEKFELVNSAGIVVARITNQNKSKYMDVQLDLIPGVSC